MAKRNGTCGEKTMSSFKIKLILFTLIIASVFIASITQQNIISERQKEYGDILTPAANAPPEIVFTTVALGGFRGLAADFLWLRINKLQEQNKFFEAYQLASWITQLQPRYTPATAYLAWNMAYNISVTFSDYETRWEWVEKGIKLIRDEALPMNPSDPVLFKELGWIYQHKMGQDLDNANMYYKTMFAKDMTKVVQLFNPDWYAIANMTLNKQILYNKLVKMKMKYKLDDILKKNRMTFQELVNFYLDKKNLLELPKGVVKYIKKEAAVVEIKRFINAGTFKRTKEETLYKLLEPTINFPEFLSDNKLNFESFQKEFRRIGHIPKILIKKMIAKYGSQNTKYYSEIIDKFMRNKWLVEVYKLDAFLIKKINDKYGFLDWRLPDAHAVYWATKGIEQADKNDSVSIECERMIIQALGQAFKGGKLLYYNVENTELINWTNNLAVVDALRDHYLSIIYGGKIKNVSSFISGFENFLIDATVSFYVNGTKTKDGKMLKAQEYYNLLKERSPDSVRFKKSLKKFIKIELLDDLGSSNKEQASATITGFYFIAFESALFGNFEKFSAFKKLAKEAYNKYQSMNEPGSRKRLTFLKQMQQNARDTFKKYRYPQMASKLDAILDTYEKIYSTKQEENKKPELDKEKK